MQSRNIALTAVVACLLASFHGNLAAAEECGPYAVTDNGEFSVEFLEYDYNPTTRQLTLFYEICKLGDGPSVKDLSHFSIDLYGFVDCLRENCTPHDLVVGCAQTAAFLEGETPGPYILEGADNPDAPKCVLGIDPTTQIAGLKFDELMLGDGDCQRFAFRLNLKCLVSTHTVTAGCIEVATKAGNQDIRDLNGTPPGYAELTGPVCVPKIQ